MPFEEWQILQIITNNYDIFNGSIIVEEVQLLIWTEMWWTNS